MPGHLQFDLCATMPNHRFSSSPLNLCTVSMLRRNDVRGISSCLPGKDKADSNGGNTDSSSNYEHRGSSRRKEEPVFLRAAVSGVTELLRVFSTDRSSPAPPIATENSNLVIEDVVDALRQDYARSYFLTGDFLDTLYTEDCVFADPTITFSGRDLYKRNLKLLVPFFEEPLLTLENIKQVEDGDSIFIETLWKLRVYLRLPWRPFIAVDGRTKFNLNAENKIDGHVESWNVTATEALGQIFKPSEKAFWMTPPPPPPPPQKVN